MYAPLVQKELGKEGASLSHERLQACFDYTARILDYNQQLNLTAITTMKDAAWLHVYDSLALLPYLIKGPSLDIGTGGGFPGVLLALATDEVWTVVDATHKKVDVVKKVLCEQSINNVRAVHARIEDLARSERGRFQNVVARAVARTDVLLEYAAPLQPVGGRLVLAKAPLSQEERAAGTKAAKLLGYAEQQAVRLVLPEQRGEREVLVFNKKSEPSVALPRKNGMAIKRPLSQIY